MTAKIETKRVKEALELQLAAVRTYAARLSAQEVEELESDIAELERAVADLKGIIESLPHGRREGGVAGASAASPATTRRAREAKGAETAAVTQRPRFRPDSF